MAARRRKDGFNWGDGHGAVHSIPLATHQKNVKTAARAALLDPSQQLSGTNLSHAASAMTRSQYGGQEAQLRTNIGDARTQGNALVANAGNYYRTVDQGDPNMGVPGAASNVDQETAIGALLNQNVADAKTAADTSIDAAGKQAQDTIAADQGVRGQIGDYSKVAGATKAAHDQATSIDQSATTAAAGQTAAYQALADLSRKAIAAQGTKAVSDATTHAQNTETSLAAQLAALKGTEGAATATNLTNLRQQAFTNLITQQGLGIKGAQLQADVAQNQAANKIRNRAITAANNRTAATITAAEQRQIDQQNFDARQQGNKTNKYGITNSAWLKMGRGQQLATIRDYTKASSAPAAGKPMSAAATQQLGTIQSALADPAQGNSKAAKQLRAALGSGNVATLTQAYIRKGQMPPLLASAAAQIHITGKLSPATAAALERLGIKLPPEWKRVSQNTAGLVAGGAGGGAAG